MQRRVLLLALVAVVVASVGLASVGTAAEGSGVPDGGLEQMDVDPDDVLIEATVDEEGDAVWEIQYRVRLATDDEEQAFEELRDDVEADPDAYTNRFGDRMTATADTAENATGREMNVTNTTVTAERRELPQSYGVLTYRFEWSNFAAVDGDRLVVGDAIDGLFLDEDTSLILAWSDGYRLGDASPSPSESRDGAVVWDGPIEFTEGEPRVTVEPEGRAFGPILLVAVGLLVAVVAAVGYRRRGGALVGGAADEPATGSEDVADAADAAGAPGAAEGEGSDDDASDGTRTGDGEGDADGGAGAPPLDDDLLSNEEQVLRLIEENGGRMKQKRVADELDWTAAKTSQVVTGLRDEGDLDGFRLGRENVLSLPEYDAGPGGATDDERDETAE
ncbi:hypothetical protein U4E84_06415 [Halorubrum sp. AD140]|uniref:helix-turn-helix transcriptional regulator n=1 Tax=Halorubrum sp. AD140 TaxID=3050073 RepID=UPI002ACD00DB|nr:hypothetical protein [Halorubrum sp. AD140]MDZ5810976.1 hypothetical protein [Halorubrum sp. AD140]